LLDDFGAAQIAFDTVEPGGAEDASHGAANLRTDADRSAIAVAKQHAFDLPAIGQPDQQLLRSIVAL
jgi:hypothetical protein